MIFPAFRAAGALAANATTTTLNVVAPTCQAGDILICAINSKDNLDVSPPDGTWTAVVEVNNTANQRASVYWKRAASSDSGATFGFTKGTDNNILFCGMISAWKDCLTAGSPITGGDGTHSESLNASSDTVTYATFDPANACTVVAIGFYNNDLTTAGSISGSDPTFTNNWDLETATGSDASIFGYSGTSTGAATGTRSHSTTSTLDDVNVGILFGLEGIPDPGSYERSEPQETADRIATTAKSKLAALALACAFVPVVSAGAAPTADAGMQGGEGGVFKPTVIQYQAVSAPVAIPPAASIPDQWWPSYPDITTKPKRTPESQYVAPIYVPDVTAPAPLLSWHPEYPDKIWKKASPTEATKFVGPEYVPDVTDPAPALSWKPEYPDRLVAPVRAAAGGSVEAPSQLGDPVVTPNITPPVYPDKVSGKTSNVLQSFTVEAPSQLGNPTLPELTWQPVYPDSVASKKSVGSASQQAIAWGVNTPTSPPSADAGGGPQDGSILFRPHVIQYSAVTGPVSTQFVTPTPTRALISFAEFEVANDLPSTVYPARLDRRYPLATYTWGQQHFGVIIELPFQPWTGTYPAAVPPKKDLRVALRMATSGRIDPPAVVQAPEITPPVYPASVAGKPDRLAVRLATSGRIDPPAVVSAPEITPPVYPDRIPAKYKTSVYVWPQQHFGVVIDVPSEAWECVYPARVPTRKPVIAQSFLVAPLLPPVAPVVPTLIQPVYPNILLARKSVAPQQSVVKPLIAITTPTRGLISFTELETPFVATRGLISWAEAETPFVATRGQISWADVETPFVATRGDVSFTELEVPNLATRGVISWAEFALEDIPIAGGSSRIGYLMVQGYFADDEDV